MFFHKLIQKLKTKNRKHVFDLDHPKVITYGGLSIGKIPFQQTLYECSLCGKQLLLDREDMQRLPRSMSHGCPGKKNG